MAAASSLSKMVCLVPMTGRKNIITVSPVRSGFMLCSVRPRSTKRCLCLSLRVDLSLF